MGEPGGLLSMGSQSQIQLKCFSSSSSSLIFTGSQKQPLTGIENNSNPKRFTRHQAEHIIFFFFFFLLTR